jgi:uncharacterized protein affecting Mg2+/Co2+ transport
MDGYYVMVTDDGERFQATVPAFSLDSADERRIVH